MRSQHDLHWHGKFAAGRPEAYTKYANEEIESRLYRALPPVHLPDRGDRDSSSDEAPVLPPPPVIIPNPALKCNRLGQFRYPPAKRHRLRCRDGCGGDVRAPRGRRLCSIRRSRCCHARVNVRPRCLAEALFRIVQYDPPDLRPACGKTDRHHTLLSAWGLYQYQLL